MAKRKTRISKLRVNEVSLVDRPANPASRVVLAKRDDDVDDIEKSKKCADPDCDNDAMKGSDYCSYHQKMQKSIEYAAYLDMSVEDIMSKDGLTDDERSELLSKTIDQYRDGILALEKLDSSDADATTTLDALETPMADNITKSEVTELLKGLSPEQTALVEQMVAKAAEAAQKPLKDQIEKAQKDASDAREEIAKRDRLAKAATLVKDTAFKAEDVAKVLEEAPKAEPFIADMLSKYAAAIRAGKVLVEIGSEHGTDATGPDAELNKAVADLRKSEPSLTEAQAFAKALANNPHLYDQMLTK